MDNERRTVPSRGGNEDCLLGDGCRIDERVTVGYRHDADAEPARIGDQARLRAGTVIYMDVAIGDEFRTGHNALVREETVMGNDVVLGTNAVVDGRTVVGSHVRFQTGVYVPPETVIADEVFLGPHAVLTNDPYPIREDVDLDGPILEDGVTIGANATVLPGVTIGTNSFVAGGAVVTEDVPPNSLAVGAPAETQPLPDRLRGGNEIA